LHRLRHLRSLLTCLRRPTFLCRLRPLRQKVHTQGPASRRWRWIILKKGKLGLKESTVRTAHVIRDKLLVQILGLVYVYELRMVDYLKT